MKIDCISDLHGNYPILAGGDLLIIAGDLTSRHTKHEFYQFSDWVKNQNYTDVIVIAGNHDEWLQNLSDIEITDWCQSGEFQYLMDSGIQLENGLKIWGSPWTTRFKGMNPRCAAFTEPNTKDLKEHWDKIPDDIDILITHCPPYGILDRLAYGACIGDMNLLKASADRIKPKLHVFGHIHECGGNQLVLKRPGFGIENNTIYVNASIVNERYELVNKPVIIKLEGKQVYQEVEN